ncbi:hypothetical protein [Herbiconiux sp. YIM B11900]|uniref:hypothetical protein n=1 Tax=Herbiconiux sp. YIM B11900 TaxID=3404131 RepID=UPI003F840C46
MTFGGFLPEDAPDPRLAQAEKIKLMPVPLMGLVPQSSLDDVHLESTMSSHGTSGMSQMAVPAVEIDTDPFVYAIGVQLARDTVLTAVIPREELQYVRVEFVRRAPRPARLST